VGLGITDHVTPFQESTRVVLTGSSVSPLVLYAPTATHHIGELYATELSQLSALPLGGGVDATDHTVPSHDSTSASGKPARIDDPTETHIRGDKQVTARSALPPAGPGTGTTDHTDPFHRSAKARCRLALPGPDEPTAMQE
jgi:hypothetical protein